MENEQPIDELRAVYAAALVLLDDSDITHEVSGSAVRDKIEALHDACENVRIADEGRPKYQRWG